MSEPLTIHLSMSELQELRDDDAGVCLACGEITFEPVEPDARRYRCVECDAHAVYGIDEAVLMGRIVIRG